MSTARIFPSLLLLLGACPIIGGDDPPATGDPGTTEVPSTSGEETAPTGIFTSTDAPTTAAHDTGDTMTEPIGTTGDESSTGEPEPPAVCGDDVVSGDEECDGDMFGCITDLCELNPAVFFSGASYFAEELGGGPGGMQGADDICNLHAAQGGLPGVYKAWLSTEKSSPARRFVHSPGRSYLMYAQQQIVAASFEDLVTGNGLYGIDEDAVGNVYDPSFVQAWTATDPDGRRAEFGTTCTDWTVSAVGSVAIGLVGSHDPIDWTNWNTGPDDRQVGGACSDRLPIYCFRQSEVCEEVACVATRAACEDVGKVPDCLPGFCEGDPCTACGAALALCANNNVDCPVTEELCAQIKADETCGC